MNRRIGILLVVVVVLVAYPAAAWVIGLSAEHTWQQREREISDKYPFLETVKHNYHRGVYSATEEVTYRIGGGLAVAMRKASGGEPAPNLQFIVRNTIHHGPLPQMRAFAPAVIDTDVVLPPQIKQKLVEVFGDQATLSIRTRLHWFGGSTTTVHSPAFERKTPQAVTINWRGLDGTSDVGSELKYTKASFTSPGLNVSSAKGKLILENIRGTTDQQSSAFEGIYLGTFGVTLARMAAEQTPAGQNGSLQNLALASKSSAQGENLDFDVSLNADAIKFQQFNITHVGYEVRLSHLHGPTVVEMNKAFKTLYADPAAPPGPDKMQEIFKTHGVELLLHDPVLELPRIGFAMPEGEFLISVKASAHGFTRAEIDGPPGELKAAVAKHLQASADLRIDTALLDKMLDMSGKGDKVTAQLQGLQRQGYLKLDGKALTTHLTFEGGQLQVNGLPFPPVGAMPQPPPGGHP